MMQTAEQAKLVAGVALSAAVPVALAFWAKNMGWQATLLAIAVCLATALAFFVVGRLLDQRAKDKERRVDFTIWKDKSAIPARGTILVLKVTNTSNVAVKVDRLWLAGQSQGQEISVRVREIPKTLQPSESLLGCVSSPFASELTNWSKRGRAKLGDGRELESRLEEHPVTTALTMLLVDEAARIAAPPENQVAVVQVDLPRRDLSSESLLREIAKGRSFRGP
jgi:hypothetical protein